MTADVEFETVTSIVAGLKPVKIGLEDYAVEKHLCKLQKAAIALWYRYRIVDGFITSSSQVPLKTHRVGQRWMLNLSRAETSSR
ncbi:hypothetical protein TNCV_3432291 [Trichonephila clavipes]|nr:hypothetical protein TNCV_3432291 [Trichonephila clavipes]